MYHTDNMLTNELVISIVLFTCRGN